MDSPAARVLITRAAAGLVVHLQNRNGALMFRQSGGFGVSSTLMCHPVGEFSIEDSDVLFGMLDVVSDRQPYGVPVWVSGPQVPVWEHSQLVIDVESGRGTGFSLEESEGMRFVSLARVVPTRHVDAARTSIAEPARVQPFRR